MKKSSPKKKISKKKIVSPPEIGKTYVAIVLDKSSSMASIKGETINHFNEQIEQIAKDSVGLDTSVSLTVFSDGVDVKFFDKNISELKPLTLKTYVPYGNTALYDGVGTTIDKLLAECKDIGEKDTAVLIIVISDGEENHSHKYNVEDISSRIQKLQETKQWTFTYLGANQNLAEISRQLHIPMGNMQAFVANSAGMAVATNMAVTSSQTYMDSRRLGSTQSSGYYNGGENK